MAAIHPFRGVRYNPRRVGEVPMVLSPPYDVISPAAQRQLYGRNPYNVVRLELGLENPTDTANDNRYTRAAVDYRTWLNINVLRTDRNPGFYVYDEIFSHDGARVTRRSLVAPVRLARWDENVILPHEQTMPKPKADRLALLTATRVQFSPLLAVYDDPGGIRDALVQASATAPIADVTTNDGALEAAAAQHRLWQLDAPELIANVVEAFEPLRLYIADGHHRYETALAYRDRLRETFDLPSGPAEYVLMALVEANDPGLVVLPTHRLIRDLGDVDRDAILTGLAENFQVERVAPGDVSARGPSGNGRPSLEVLGLTPDVTHRLTLRPDVDLAQLLPDVPPVLRELDTLILQRLILEPLLGFSRDPAETDARIRYSRDRDEALRAYSSGDASLVFFLAPTPLERIRQAMRSGARMPQKTTYFYPKPVTGLVFFDHDVAWN